MRLAFLGTAPFSVPSLRACARDHEVVVVVTQPDRPGDRGRPAPRPVADAAAELGIPLQQPHRLRAPEAIATLLAARPDALVVAAYGQILSPALLDAPPLGGINVHASLLPRWRGAAPVAAAIRAGDAETGVAIMQMEAGLDTGPVYAMRSTPIGERETTPELTGRLAEMGADLLAEVLAALAAGAQPEPVPQDDARATIAPRLRREDGVLRWEEITAAEAERLVRAMVPWPGTTARVAGEEVRIHEASAVAGTEPPGTVMAVTADGVDVACRAGLLRLLTVQPPGRRAMPAADWARGRRLRPARV